MKPVRAAAIALAATPAAFAEPAGLENDAGVNRLDTIIVTSAPGPDRTADELIGAATVLTRDAILDDLSGSLGDSIDRQPGVSSSYFGPAASRPILRGLGADRVLVLTNGIGVIDASAASPDHQAGADAIDADRVEILRGPAALAYGGQAIGGVVNVIDGLIVETAPDKPLSFTGYGASQSVNDGAEGGAKITIGAGPIAIALLASAREFGETDIPGFAESSAFHAAEEHEDEEEGRGDEETEGLLENSQLSTSTLGLGVSLVGDSAFIGAGIRQQYSEYGLIGHGHEHGEEGDEETGEDHDDEALPFIDLEQTRFDLRGGLKFADGPVRKVVGTAAFADYAHTEFEGPGAPGTSFSVQGEEARLEIDHTPALGLEGAFGLQYAHKDFAARGEESFIPATQTTNIGLFVYEARDFANGAGIEGGLRWERSDIEAEAVADQSFDAASASFGAHRHFDNGVFLGAQLAYTQRAPTNVELFAEGPHLATRQYEVGDPSLDLEAGLHGEATLRWTSHWLTLSANAFVTDFSDFIHLAPRNDEIDGLPVYEFTQQDAEFHGGELTAEAHLSSRFAADWVLDAGLDWVEAELANGDPVPFIPPLTARFGAKAQWSRLMLGADISHAFEQDDPGAGDLPTDAYTLVDLSTAWTLSEAAPGTPGVKLFAQLRNVGDEEARPATSVLKDLVPLPGRNLRIGVRLNY